MRCLLFVLFVGFYRVAVRSTLSFENRPTARSGHRHSAGFTLLELLVVIALLAAIAGATVLAYEDVEEQGRVDVTRTMLVELRKALLQFRRDSGTNDFPGQGIYACSDAVDPSLANPALLFPPEAGASDADQIAWCQSPANFWMLFVDPLGTGWNPDSKRGWNGPYLQRRNGLIAYLGVTDLWGVLNPYQSPFILRDLDDDDSARIISLGADGIDNGIGANVCVPPMNADDSVLCLLR